MDFNKLTLKSQEAVAAAQELARRNGNPELYPEHLVVALLDQGPREAPEPETAEERSHRLGMRTTAGGIVAGGAIAAKVGALGGLGKAFIWLFAWNGVRDAWRLGGWIAIALLAAAVTVYLVLRSRRQQS